MALAFHMLIGAPSFLELSMDVCGDFGFKGKWKIKRVSCVDGGGFVELVWS